MTEPIRVLIVDDVPETREHLATLLGFESDIAVVGAAGTGKEALEQAATLHPDIVLMDVNMPDLDGIATTEQLAAKVPTAAVIMMSVEGEADQLRRSMLAGAREFLVKPFGADVLVSAIRQVREREREKLGRLLPPAGTVAQHAPTGNGKIVALFSPKGGVGRTTIAVNVAVAAADLGKRVVLVDGSFQFGDVGVLLNLNPKNKSIADLANELEGGADPDTIDAFVVRHSSGIGVLLAPPRPEMADLITPAGFRRALEALRGRYDMVVVDCSSVFNDHTLAILDTADVILTLLTLEITSIKNMRLFLGVADQLGYRDRLQLVLNRADSNLGIRLADVEHSIGRKVSHTIVSDGRSVVSALNRGIPFYLSEKDAQVSRDVRRLAAALVSTAAEAPHPEPARQRGKRSLFARK